MSKADKVVAIAESWVGCAFRPGMSAQCANFVRAVYAEAGVELNAASAPDDIKYLGKGYPQGPTYANSFAGDDVGVKISRLADVKPGDIVMFRNTYGEYPDGTITHVGIALNSSFMIHRPTSSRPVEIAELSGNWRILFSQARRVLKAEDTRRKLKLFAHGGIVKAYDGPAGGSMKELERMRLKIFFHNGKLGLALNGQALSVMACDMDFVISGSRRLKVFCHDGKASVIYALRNLLSCEMSLAMESGNLTLVREEGQVCCPDAAELTIDYEC